MGLVAALAVTWVQSHLDMRNRSVAALVSVWWWAGSESAKHEILSAAVLLNVCRNVGLESAMQETPVGCCIRSCLW